MKKKEYIQPELLSVLLPFVPLMVGTDTTDYTDDGSGDTSSGTGDGGNSESGEGSGSGGFPI